MKIGSVIENQTGLHVITQTINGVVADTLRLDDYIMKNTIMQEDGEWKSIKEIVEKRCAIYLMSGVEIIKEH